ncbi:phosphatase PAP2 family protein [Mycolicibacterium sediminis]|uniref:Phosphatase PAP2 family protein n=1 Tax=Mycolicibacterium sediminis TaxID=1286180 RepID=A0A7I7QMN0_9MYCO|nr:phosphatase PAP2 family protein [Mycolicibacterium sediminis]BBY27648.1 phosphatase PAP2 family protein [Mycolicibacterium sediminis]
MIKRAHVLVALAVLALLVYASMWVGFTSPWRWLTDVDTSTLAAAHRAGDGDRAWVTFWNGLCTVFSPLVLRVVAVVLIVYAFVRRRPRVGCFLLLCAVMSGPLTELAKYVADRPRPDTAMVHASSTSFPSGHALGVMACVLALCVVTWPLVRPALRPLVVAAAVLVIVGVGVGRVALNVHHASDVVAGWALGYAWFVLCLPVLGARVSLPAAGTPVAPGTGR